MHEKLQSPYTTGEELLKYMRTKYGPEVIQKSTFDPLREKASKYLALLDELYPSKNQQTYLEALKMANIPFVLGFNVLYNYLASNEQRPPELHRFFPPEENPSIENRLAQLASDPASTASSETAIPPETDIGALTGVRLHPDIAAATIRSCNLAEHLLKREKATQLRELRDIVEDALRTGELESITSEPVSASAIAQIILYQALGNLLIVHWDRIFDEIIEKISHEAIPDDYPLPVTISAAAFAEIAMHLNQTFYPLQIGELLTRAERALDDFDIYPGVGTSISNATAVLYGFPPLEEAGNATEG